jgi:membrane protein
MSSAFATLARADAPWRETLAVLRQRFGEDRLALTASSLTFTTLISLVPLLTVMLALFSAFPVFGQFQDAVQRFFVSAVVPEVIAKPVLHALTQFTAKASRLGAVGLGVFVAGALVLMLTIDRTLNSVWRVARPRPLAQRVLVYWAAITLGPLLVAASIGVTSVAVAASRGWQGAIGDTVGVLLATVELGVLTAGLAALYHYVPNTPVRWRHAGIGGLIAAGGLLLGKQGLAWYLKAVPTFSVVYGAFATVPILLVWIYLAWVVVLLGAVVAAYAPALEAGVRRRPAAPGLGASLALEMLALLYQARANEKRGLTLADFTATMHTDPLQLEPVLDGLLEMDWVGRLDEQPAPRYVLLCDPATVRIAPLLDRWVLAASGSASGLRDALAVGALPLSDVLPGVGDRGALPARPAHAKATPMSTTPSHWDASNARP